MWSTCIIVFLNRLMIYPILFDAIGIMENNLLTIVFRRPGLLGLDGRLGLYGFPSESMKQMHNPTRTFTKFIFNVSNIYFYIPNIKMKSGSIFYFFLFSILQFKIFRLYLNFPFLTILFQDVITEI